MRCRNCKSAETERVIDLGTSPVANNYIRPEDLDSAEPWVPLSILFCKGCSLVQTVDFHGESDIFKEEYAYFSSVSTSWLEHAERFVGRAVERFQLGSDSLVIEVAANDGYLLRFVRARGIRCVGIEPTRSTAAAARELGLEVVEEFLGVQSAAQVAAKFGTADLVVANNVLAHVPDLADFVGGLALLLKADGVLSLEFPRVTSLVMEGQFDTIYHEHFSYFSLTSAIDVLARSGLEVFDVEELPTHGGSIRIYAQHVDAGKHATSDAVGLMLLDEAHVGVSDPEFYRRLGARAIEAKMGLLGFLLSCREAGESVVAYGAAAKGNTLLNFAGVRADLLPFVVDRSPAKVGLYLPGSRIPIRSEASLAVAKPVWVLILPWNLRDEIAHQLRYARDWGARFATAVPSIHSW